MVSAPLTYVGPGIAAMHRSGTQSLCTIRPQGPSVPDTMIGPGDLPVGAHTVERNRGRLRRPATYRSRFLLVATTSVLKSQLHTTPGP